MAEPISPSARGNIPFLATEIADPAKSRFPDYLDPFESPVDIMADSPLPRDSMNPMKAMLGKVKDDPTRHPSPQPTHFSVPLSNNRVNGNGNGHKVLRSATVGYVAPEFAGKVEQMKQGEHLLPPP